MPKRELCLQEQLYNFLLPLYNSANDTRPATLWLTQALDLDDIHVVNGVELAETDLHQRLRQFVHESDDSSTTSMASTWGIRAPDLSKILTLKLEHDVYRLTSLLIEIKPDPESLEKGRMAIAQQNIMYLLTSCEWCGCWLGMAFHAKRFTCMVAYDNQTVAIESASNPSSVEDVPVGTLLRGRRELYPWHLGTVSVPNVAHFKVLWDTDARSIEILRNLPIDRPLQPLERPAHFDGIFTETGLKRLDLSTDDELLRVVSLVRPAFKKALTRRRERQARDSGNGGGQGGGSGRTAVKEEEMKQEEEAKEEVEVDEGKRMFEAVDRAESMDRDEDDLGPTDAVNKEYDIAEFIQLLHGVSIKLVSREIMDRLIFNTWDARPLTFRYYYAATDINMRLSSVTIFHSRSGTARCQYIVQFRSAYSIRKPSDLSFDGPSTLRLCRFENGYSQRDRDQV